MVTMGEPDSIWAGRIAWLAPHQVNMGNAVFNLAERQMHLIKAVKVATPDAPAQWEVGYLPVKQVGL